LWDSDRTGAFRNWDGMGNNVIEGDPFKASLDGGGNTFTQLDGGSVGWATNSNYIVGDIRLQGLSFGLFMRNIFRPADVGVEQIFVDKVLKDMVFGVKFEMSPIEVAAQFLVRDYSVYLGGRWFVGPVTVGLSFMGILAPKSVDTVDYAKDAFDDITDHVAKITYKSDDITMMRVGGGVDYNADSFGATLKGYLSMMGAKKR